MKNAIKISGLILIVFLVSGCNTLRKAFPQYSKNDPAPNNTLPDDYTVTGTTTQNFQFVPIRTPESAVTVRVQRPNEGWYTCDQFEVRIATAGANGNGVRLWYLNLVVNGIGRPVAPTGSKYEIRSIRTGGSSGLGLY